MLLSSQIEEYLRLHRVSILELIDQEVTVSVIYVLSKLIISCCVFLKHVPEIQLIVKEGQIPLFSQYFSHPVHAFDGKVKSDPGLIVCHAIHNVLESFLSQFIGMNEPVVFGDNADAISCATFSSRAVEEAINGVLRGEWGYEGVVMTDWWACSDIADELAAGSDVKMPERITFIWDGADLDPTPLHEKIAAGKLDRGICLASARRVLKMMDHLD